MTDDWSLSPGGTTEKPQRGPDSARFPTYKKLIAMSTAKGSFKQYLREEGNVLSVKYPFLTRHQIQKRARKLWSQMSDVERQNYTCIAPSLFKVQTTKKKTVATRLRRFRSPGCFLNDTEDFVKTGGAVSHRWSSENLFCGISRSQLASLTSCIASVDLPAAPPSSSPATTLEDSAVDTSIPPAVGSSITPVVLSLAEAPNAGKQLCIASPSAKFIEAESPELRLRRPLASRTYSLASRLPLVTYKTPDIVENEPTSQLGILKKGKEETRRPGGHVSFSAESDSRPSNVDKCASPSWSISVHKSMQRQMAMTPPTFESSTFSNGATDVAGSDSGDSDDEKELYLACLHNDSMITRSKVKVRGQQKVTISSSTKRRKRQCTRSSQRSRHARLSSREKLSRWEQHGELYNFNGESTDPGLWQPESQDNAADFTSQELKAAPLNVWRSMMIQQKVQSPSPVALNSSSSVISGDSGRLKQLCTRSRRTKLPASQHDLQTPRTLQMLNHSGGAKFVTSLVQEALVLARLKKAGTGPTKWKKTEGEGLQRKRDRARQSLNGAVASLKQRARPRKAGRKTSATSSKRKPKAKVTKQPCSMVAKDNLQAMAQSRRQSPHLQSLGGPPGKGTPKTMERRKSALTERGHAFKARRAVAQGLKGDMKNMPKKTKSCNAKKHNSPKVPCQESSVSNGVAMQGEEKDNLNDRVAEPLEKSSLSKPRLSFLERMRKRASNGKKVKECVSIRKERLTLSEAMHGKNIRELKTETSKSVWESPTAHVDIYELGIDSPLQCVPKKLSRNVRKLTGAEAVVASSTCHSPSQTGAKAVVASSTCHSPSQPGAKAVVASSTCHSPSPAGALLQNESILSESTFAYRDAWLVSDNFAAESDMLLTSDAESNDSRTSLKKETPTALEQAIQSMHRVMSPAAEDDIVSPFCADLLSSDSPAWSSSLKQSVVALESPTLPVATMLKDAFRTSVSEDLESNNDSDDARPDYFTVTEELPPGSLVPELQGSDLCEPTSKSEQETRGSTVSEGLCNWESQGSYLPAQGPWSGQQQGNTQGGDQADEPPGWDGAKTKVVPTVVSSPEDASKQQKQTSQLSGAKLCLQPGQGALCDLFDLLHSTQTKAQTAAGKQARVRAADAKSGSTEEEIGGPDAIFM